MRGKEVTLRNKIIFGFEFHLHAEFARWSSYSVNFGEMENQAYVQTHSTGSLAESLLQKQEMELQYYRNCAINSLYLHRSVARKGRATGSLVDNKFLETFGMCINCEDHCWGFLSSLLSHWLKFGNSITELKEYCDKGGFRLQFSFNAMAILQGHWCFGIINKLSSPPSLNGKYYLYAHCWVLQVCQASSQGLIKESSTSYWYMVFVYHKVQRPGVCQ